MAGSGFGVLVTVAVGEAFVYRISRMLRPCVIHIARQYMRDRDAYTPNAITIVTEEV